MRSRIVRFPSSNKRHALYLDVGSELGMGGPSMGTASLVCPDSRELALDGVYLGHLIWSEDGGKVAIVERVWQDRDPESYLCVVDAEAGEAGTYAEAVFPEEFISFEGDVVVMETREGRLEVDVRKLEYEPLVEVTNEEDDDDA